MKQTILSILLCALIACGGESSQVKTWESRNSEVENDSKTQEADELVGTWYVKEILINGKPDLENFPVKNDELTLNVDMSVISIDKTFDMKDTGTWKRLGQSQFSIKTGDETVIFEVLKINSAEMSNQMVTDEIDMVINYSKKK